jgi:hypothetical protein
MIHIVFNEADAAVLQKAFELDNSFTGDVVLVRDDYSVGPIKDIYTTEGIEARKEWWRQVQAGGDYDGLVDKNQWDDNKTVASLIERLENNEEEICWIWAAQNKHDVCGYYWLMSQLKNLQGRIFILYLNNLPFINEKGLIFYPDWLHAIPPKEFLKAKKLARLVTLSEFEVDPDEWTRLQNEDKGVRLLEGGKKISQQDYDYYDGDLKKFITADWQKASRVIHNFQNKSKQSTGDAFLLWRLKNLLAGGEFDIQGELKGMKDFEIKLKSAQPAIAE